MTKAKLVAGNLFAVTLGRLHRAPGRLRVLTFHGIAQDPEDWLVVTPGQFQDFLQVLIDEGYRTVRAGDVATGWPGILELDRAVVLTFDDGLASQADIAQPALSAYGMTASFFVISGCVNPVRTRSAALAHREPYLSQNDVRGLHAAGFEVGSHSRTHARVGMLAPEAMRAELGGSREALQQLIGCPVISFAYPFGRRGSFSDTVRTAVAESGYRIALTQEGVRVTTKTDLLRFPRTSIDGTDTAATFRRKLHGQYELWSGLRR